MNRASREQWLQLPGCSADTADLLLRLQTEHLLADIRYQNRGVTDDRYYAIELLDIIGPGRSDRRALILRPQRRDRAQGERDA